MKIKVCCPRVSCNGRIEFEFDPGDDEEIEKTCPVCKKDMIIEVTVTADAEAYEVEEEEDEP